MLPDILLLQGAGCPAGLQLLPRRSDIACESESFEPADHIPANIDLPPSAPKPRRICIRVVILMPVLSPGPELQRSQPPDVAAGINPFGQVRSQVQQAIDEHLKVQGIDQPDSANPEEALPAQQQPHTYGKYDDGGLQLSPYPVARPIQVGTPAANIRVRPLIDPSDVRPPEPTVSRA